MDNFEKEYNEACRNYAQGRKFETYVEELFDGQEKFFGELRVVGTFDYENGLEDVKIMLVNNGKNEQPIAVDITAMVSEDKVKQLIEFAHERVAEELNKAYKEIYECMP